MEQTELPYHVRLASFEGPLDLLLHLIKKNEVNIYDIPIARITQQYLDYLSMMKSLNLAVAGEFLVMAATLIHIKSRMLLPAEELDPDDGEGPDPREELVQRLLEYKRYKDAAGQLEQRERLWRDCFERVPPSSPGAAEETIFADVTLFDLLDALHGLLARSPTARMIEIVPENLTVKDRMNALLEVLDGKESVTFRSLFVGQHHRLLIIVTFLALLELVRLRLIRVFQAELFGPILLTRAFSPPFEAPQGGEPVEPLTEDEAAEFEDYA